MLGFQSAQSLGSCEPHYNGLENQCRSPAARICWMACRVGSVTLILCMPARRLDQIQADKDKNPIQIPKTGLFLYIYVPGCHINQRKKGIKVNLFTVSTQVVVVVGIDFPLVEPIRIVSPTPSAYIENKTQLFQCIPRTFQLCLKIIIFVFNMTAMSFLFIKRHNSFNFIRLSKY